MSRRTSSMTDIAHGMGFSGITAIPEDRIPEFCNIINGIYGNKKARMMVLRQLLYRRGMDSSKAKFRDIWDFLRKNKNRSFPCQITK